jgi:hypothetical protein
MVTWARKVANTPLADLLAQYHNDHPTWSEELIRLMCK